MSGQEEVLQTRILKSSYRSKEVSMYKDEEADIVVWGRRGGEGEGQECRFTSYVSAHITRGYEA